MAKSVHDDVLDGALTVIRNGCDKMTACSAEPASFADGNDFTVANGDTSGRKLTVAAKSGVPVDAGGTANHVALLDTVNARLLYVTTATAQALTAGNTITFNAWDIEIADPA